MLVVSLFLFVFTAPTLAGIEHVDRHNDLALSNFIIMLFFLLHNDLRPLFDLAILFALYGVVDYFLAASPEHLLLQDGRLVSFTIVMPIIELVVAGFDHWDHAAPSHEANAQNKAK